MATYCVDQTPISTVTDPEKTPTGLPVAPSCYPPADPNSSDNQGETSGYVPEPKFINAAIATFCAGKGKGKLDIKDWMNLKVPPASPS